MNPNLSGSKDSSANDGVSNAFSGSKFDVERSYIRSLATSFAWAASGGKSGASFSVSHIHYNKLLLHVNVFFALKTNQDLRFIIFLNIANY